MRSIILRKKIKVLIIDDSLLIRKALSVGLSKDPGIEVVGTASDPFMARDMILELEPDVLTLDVEMPKMNGIEFLKRLMPQYPLPVVMVSSVNARVFDAMNAGAVDYISKQDRSLDALINELIVKIKIASTAKVGHWKANSSDARLADSASTDSAYKVIAIGASTGGTEAVYNIIKQFPWNMPGTVIVQHMPPGFTALYAERLNNSCAMEVREAKTGDKVVQGTVLLAPGDFQMRLKKVGNVYSVECYKGERVSGHCPSVDVLFESVAAKAGPEAIGVILTGMGSDGAKGLLAIRQKGGVTFGQNEASSVVYGMPKVAYDIGAVQKQGDLMEISKLVYSTVDRK